MNTVDPNEIDLDEVQNQYLSYLFENGDWVETQELLNIKEFESISIEKIEQLIRFDLITGKEENNHKYYRISERGRQNIESGKKLKILLSEYYNNILEMEKQVKPDYERVKRVKKLLGIFTPITVIFGIVLRVYNELVGNISLVLIIIGAYVIEKRTKKMEDKYYQTIKSTINSNPNHQEIRDQIDTLNSTFEY